ncbi:MAG: trypsin-like peptidase domain-containing protein [Thermogutta sp.]
MSGSQLPQSFDPYYSWLGIPQQERPISYYRLLGLAPFESNENVIEAAVDQRLAFLRTKTLGPHAVFAEQLMGEITRARSVLLDPEKKRSYDAALTKLLQDNRLAVPAEGLSAENLKSQGPDGLDLSVAVRRKACSRPKKSRNDLLIACSTATVIFLLVGAGVLFFLEKERQPTKDVAKLGDRAPVAVAPQRPKKAPVNEKVGEVPPPRDEVRQEVPPPRPAQADVVPPVVHNHQPGNVDAIVPAAAQAGIKEWLEKVKKATVVVEGNRSQGSGFLVKMSSGKIVAVTNAHVLTNNANIRIKLADGREFSIKQAAVFPEFDAAFLAVDGGMLPEVLELREDLPKESERVFAYGAPLGLMGTLTEGIVSAIRRTSEIRENVGGGGLDNPVRKAEAFWIQTSAPISPGNSGGPLLDENGKVVGMNTMGINNLLGQNMNFALSSVEIVRLLAAPRFADLPKDELLLAEHLARPAPQRGPKLAGIKSPEGSYPFETYSFPEIRLPSGAVFQAGSVRPPQKWRMAIESGHVLVLCRGQLTLSPTKEVGGGFVTEVAGFAAIAEGDRGAAAYQGSVNRSYVQPGVVSPFAFYVDYDEDEVMRAALAFYKGLLNGPAVLFNANGHPYLIANYYRGTRTGPLVVYDEEQYPALYVEFTRNRKHGLVCLFEQHLPCWIENWEANRQVEACQIRWQNNQPAVILQAALTSPEDLAFAREKMATVLRYLDEVESLESKMKREVVEAFRWADNQVKSRRAAAFSVAATEAILARHAEREAAGAALRAEAQARFRAGAPPRR